MITARHLLAIVEPALYSRRGRPLTLALLLLATVLLLWQALQIQPSAGFEKSLPIDHPYMQVFKQYQQDFGGANSVLVALERTNGDIYDEHFLAALKSATDEVFFTPGIDRAHVSSIFTRDVRFIEVVDGGFVAGDVVPATYTPSPEMFARIRANVDKAGLVGRMVSTDQRAAMVVAEVLETDPITNRQTDYAAVAHALEDQVRQRFTHPTRYQYKLKHDLPPFAAGEVVATGFTPPGWWLPLRHFDASKKNPDGDAVHVRVSGRDVEVVEDANPQYDPNLRVHIIGFTMMVGAISDGIAEVAGFFALTVLGTMLALWWYLGNLRLAWLPLCCSLVAVVWEFGLLRLCGFGLDPFSVMVPFLVLAVSTSHGVQYVNTWADEVMQGHDGFEASRASFRRLFIPGSIALLTNVAGFLTIYLVPIGTIREMAINACLGMFAVIATNKMLMPIWLSYLTVTDVQVFRAQRLARRNASDRLWRKLSVVTTRPVAALLILGGLVLLGITGWYQQYRIIGDAQTGAPELRPDSVYNQDVQAITRQFAIGTDVLKIIAETDANTCTDHGVLDQIDEFAWHLQNTEGIQSDVSFSGLVRKSYAGMMEMNPKFAVLPRNQNVLVLVNRAITTETGLLNFDCHAMPVIAFATDHKATTLDHILSEADRFNQENARDFYAAHPDAQPAACERKYGLWRTLGVTQAQWREHEAALRAGGMKDDAVATEPRNQKLLHTIETAKADIATLTGPCPVLFSPATGNVGVMAATNAVVEATELPALLWIYAVIAVLLLLSYRSAAGLLAIGIPLFMVSVLANALMAFFGIGLKVATLPVVTLAVGIGVDYGIYIYDLLQHHVRAGLPIREAYFQTLRQTGKAVVFTGVCLAGGVATWLFSDLQFQRDMGLLLMCMFTANMLGAVLLCPAFSTFLLRADRGTKAAPNTSG